MYVTGTIRFYINKEDAKDIMLADAGQAVKLSKELYVELLLVTASDKKAAISLTNQTIII